MSWEQGLQDRDKVKALSRMTQKKSLRTPDVPQTSEATGPAHSRTQGSAGKLAGRTGQNGWVSCCGGVQCGQRAEESICDNSIVNQTIALNEKMINSREPNIREERKETIICNVDALSVRFA